MTSSQGYELNNWLMSGKKVSQALTTTSTDIKEAGKFMNLFGKKEGSDLSDLTERMGQATSAFADALDKVAIHNENSRKIIKEIRSAEEALAALHSKRKSLQSDIEKAAKKQKSITEMSAELANLDREILEKEAATYTLKRQKLYSAMQLQFDAMAELSAKTHVIAVFAHIKFRSTDASSLSVFRKLQYIQVKAL